MKINGTPDGGGKSAVIEGLTITSNGTYTAGSGVDGYSPVEVDVPAPEFVTETLSVSANGTYTPSEGIDGYSQVVVDVPQSVTGFTQKEITEGVQIVNLSNSASYVSANTFNSNTTIQTVNLPYATSVGASAFNGCTSLTQMSLPMCSYIGDYAFYNCMSLNQVSIPMCSYIGAGVFQYGYLLTQMSLPMCSYIDNYAFNECYLLNQVSLPMCSYIGYGVFYECSSLSIITIGYSGICSLDGSETFYSTQITSSTGSIYVPASLVDAYKSAENWSYFSTQIFPIE